MATGAVPVRIRTAISLFVENSHLETRHQGVMFRSPRTFVASSLTFKLIFLPAGRQQDHEHGEELQSAGQHIEHQHAFGQGTEQSEILGGTD